MNTETRALTPTTGILAWCLHLLVFGLLAVVAVRAIGTPVVAMAAVCLIVYATGPLLLRRMRTRRAAVAWIIGLGVAWLLLLMLTADAVWLAFPLYFLQLHLLPRRAGLAAVAATAALAVGGYAAHQGSMSVAIVIGPVLGAAVAVAVAWGYQALYRESEQRRRLIEELTATRADLAAAQHKAGVLAERERLAREIHDTLAQGLSSIQLLLRAAERALLSTPDSAARYLGQARQAAADNLGEARRFVAALAPPALDDATLAAALERLCATTGSQHKIAVRFRVVGEPVPLPTGREVALLRIAQSAIANTVQHAEATFVELALCFRDGHVALVVTDDGRGFDLAQLSDGFGLTTMRSRAEALGGTFAVESASGRGTVLTAALPLGSTDAHSSAPGAADRPPALAPGAFGGPPALAPGAFGGPPALAPGASGGPRRITVHGRILAEDSTHIPDPAPAPIPDTAPAAPVAKGGRR
ncbi:MAG: sensor histidine kinase [Hamadaea sp.]|uniref:sensor histidine kinase n=1 Tax=Hamadaea sp. TaxID=2024425 RepID=UPI0017E68F15|nr:sensor histidine kinase [Hamadaea sp.]NUT18733.1 sensor histidine kinase [Hamadaea sp.]